jgi:hypothetical protein
LRTLTLGLLVASGGTLAALPFRRYPVLPDASSAPAQLTGPTRSALDKPAIDEPEVETAAHVSMLASLPPLPGLDSPLPVPNAPPQRLRMDVPLSYEDLALPLDQPPVIDERFNATTKVHRQRLEQERVDLVMPDIESLAAKQQKELQRAATTAQQQLATGTQASSERRDAQIERLPESSPAERERHWIRQPD